MKKAWSLRVVYLRSRRTRIIRHWLVFRRRLRSMPFVLTMCVRLTKSRGLGRFTPFDN